jgi:hypothetical protein
MISWTTTVEPVTTQTYSSSFSSSWSSSRSATGTSLGSATSVTITNTFSTQATSSASSSASRLIDWSATQQTQEFSSQSGRTTFGTAGAGTPTTGEYTLPPTSTTIYRPTIALRTTTETTTSYTFYPTFLSTQLSSAYTTSSNSDGNLVTSLTQIEVSKTTTSPTNSQTTQWLSAQTTFDGQTQYDPALYASVYKATPQIFFGSLANQIVHEAIYTIAGDGINDMGQLVAASAGAASQTEVTILPTQSAVEIETYDASEEPTTVTLLFTTDAVTFQKKNTEEDPETFSLVELNLNQNLAEFPMRALAQTRRTALTADSSTFQYPFASSAESFSFTCRNIYEHNLWFSSAITYENFDDARLQSGLTATWSSTEWSTNGDASIYLTQTASDSDGSGGASSSSSSESHGTTDGGGQTYAPLQQIGTTRNAINLTGDDVIIGGGGVTVQAPLSREIYGLGGFVSGNDQNLLLEANFEGSVFYSPEEGQTFFPRVQGPPDAEGIGRCLSSVFPGEFFFQSSDFQSGSMTISNYSYTVTTGDSDSSGSLTGEFSGAEPVFSVVRKTDRGAVFDFAESFVTLGYEPKSGETVRERIREGVYLMTVGSQKQTTSYTISDTTYGFGETRQSSHFLAVPYVVPYTEPFASGKIAGVSSAAAVYTALLNRVAQPPLL